MFNWLFVFGNNQKIEFRNFFNQISDNSTILRTGRDFYGGSYKKATELALLMREKHVDIFSLNNELQFMDNEVLEELIKPNQLLKTGYTLKEINEHGKGKIK